LWRKRAARLAGRLLALCQSPDKGQWLANPYVMHVSRLCLMLADHHYSSLAVDEKGKPAAGRVTGQKNYPLYANTQGQMSQLNQTLDEHLLGVAQHSSEVSHALPRFELNLPRLARHRALKKRAQDARYRWQDKAFDSGIEWLQGSAEGLDATARTVTLDNGNTLSFDVLSVNSGPVQDRLLGRKQDIDG